MKQVLTPTSTRKELRATIENWRLRGDRIALLPTMGALHDGHLSLVDLARQHAHRVIVSIFVNPKQFGAHEDLALYPRDQAADLEKLQEAKVDLLYSPSVEQIYPDGFSTSICVSGVSNGLCGGARPGHFDGVATVVTKLLQHCTPDVAVFGEKDYQQLLVVRRLVSDLELPVDIIGAEIVRETNGLALSSRNRYLSSEERKTAPLLHQVLLHTAKRLGEGQSMSEAGVAARESLRAAGFRLDYFELRDAATLEPLARTTGKPARLLIAAKLGTTRLIDNIAVMG